MPNGARYRPSNPRNLARAKNMRRDPTDAERKMWLLLRDRRLADYKFRRQVPFQNYILDFVCFERRVIVEIDGSQHASSSRDETRDGVVAREGFRVLRYWNNDVLQRSIAVLDDIVVRMVLAH